MGTLTKWYVAWLGVTGLLAATATVLGTYLYAWVCGTETLVIHINNYGEMMPEIAMLSFSVLAGAYGLCRIIRRDT